MTSSPTPSFTRPSSNAPRNGNFVAAACAVALLILLAYANHFENAFHFDDMHTVTENPWVRSLHNIPKFFTDTDTFSTLPANRSYRPFVTMSLAFDYWLGRGANPRWFHITTFLWFLLQIYLMFVMFRATLERVRPNPNNKWLALFAAALYGVHPVIAETVNYIIQRSDLYSTLDVVAALAIYMTAPKLRKYGIYLIPVATGILSKPPAAMFFILLFAWLVLFEDESPVKAAVRCLPAALVCGVGAWFVARMTPASYVTGALSPLWYRLTQPYILLGYFVKFFVPLGLSADTDKTPFPTMTGDAIVGFAFVGLLLGFIWWSYFGGGKARRELRPLTFGAVWFLVASIPTSWVPLAEVENDHRMYFPFVGLVLAVCQGGAILWSRKPVAAKLTAPVCVAILALFAYGTRERNRVWLNDEALWKDVTEKSPRNGRGLMNYGLTLMAKADYAGALDYFNRALAFTPNYYILEINMGIAYGAINNAAQAEAHFGRAILLAPSEASPHNYYGRWLCGVNRTAEGVAQLRTALQLNPDLMDARYTLMQALAGSGDQAGLRAAAQDTLARFPGEPTATSWLARAASIKPVQMTPEAYLTISLSFFRAGRFADCVQAAKQAIQLKPDYAEAWNNVGACYNSLSQWDLGIEACRQAIRFKPDFQLAKNNLAWAEGQKAKSEH